jgi:hypothetical protein
MLLWVIKFDFQTDFLDVPGQRAGFVVLAAFLATFLFIRTSARLMRSPKVPWWPGSVTTDSGLHLHHLVWGIVLIMLAGFLGYAVNPVSPWNELLAAAFGIGCGLTLDEFALWIYLRDVYWAKEGRASFDAVVMATVLGMLIILGAAPLDLPRNAPSLEVLILTVVLDVGLAVTAILKGKPMLGMVGIFLIPVSLVASLRLASPRSPWARRFYPPDGKKLERSRGRWRRIQRRRRRVSDLIAGAPEPDPE